MNKFCKKCGTYYNTDYELDHIYECYSVTTYTSSGTANYRITLPGVYKLIEKKAIDPNRAMYKLANFGLIGKDKNESTS